VLCAGLVAALGFADTVAGVAVLWLLAGAGNNLVWAGLNTLAVEAVPSNRAGATSLVGALKFAGNAAAPVMWLPLYTSDPRLGFSAAAVLALATGLLVAPLRSSEGERRSRPPEPAEIHAG
jgi:MFS family permease